MKIKLLVIGKTDDKNLNELISIYQKRLQHYISFQLEIIPDLKNSKNLSQLQQKEKEGELILNKIQSTDQLILLDEKGISIARICQLSAKENELRNQTIGLCDWRTLWIL